MTTYPAEVPLPEPFDYCYEWDGPYGTRKFSIAAHNGRKCDRSMSLFTASQMLAYGSAREAAAREAECERWKSSISRVMPPDFKDWHENSDVELPDVAAWVIENLRARRNAAEDALEAVQQWISVDERRPEKFVEVLVAFAEQSLPSTGQYTGNPSDHDGWCYPRENADWSEAGHDRWPTVKWWQPLPDHPEEARFALPPAPNTEGAPKGDAT